MLSFSIGTLILVFFLLLICTGMSWVLRIVSALHSFANALMGLGLIAAALWMGSETLATSILVGHQSNSWPSVEIRPLRLHTSNLTPIRGDIHQQTELAYEYVVDGEPYRSDLFDAHGGLRRSRDTNQFFSKERFADSRAHYNPESPNVAVLQPGIVFDQRANFYTALLCLGLAQFLFGVFCGIDPRSRHAKAPDLSRPGYSVARKLSAVVVAGFVVVGLVFALRWITAKELSGKPKDAAYKVVSEETYPGGLRYRISVYQSASAHRMESIIPAWLVSDYLDTEYRGPDGQLHPITERTWLFYKSWRHLEVNEIDPDEEPDFEIRWTESEGVTQADSE